MALVKCPECGREKVSDSAVACPECGYGIKAHFDRIKQEEKKRLKDKIENKSLHIRTDHDNKATNNNRLNTIKKKFFQICVSCLILVIIFLVGMFISKESEINEAIENGQSGVARIEEYTSDINSKLKNADVIYGSFSCNAMIDNITDTLFSIEVRISSIDSYYSIDNRVSTEIDEYVSKNTSDNSWKEYKQNILNKYFIDSTINGSAEMLVKNVAYSSSDEYREDYKSKNVIVESLNHSISGSNYKIYGVVTNNSSNTVKFVKVKISIMNADGKVIDTKSTYACGDEGLAPNESTKFECFIDKNSEADSFSAEIYDYD